MLQTTRCSKLRVNYIKEISTYSRIMKLCNEQQLQSKIEEKKIKDQLKS